jgi:hypothetical protein
MCKAINNTNIIDTNIIDTKPFFKSNITSMSVQPIVMNAICYNILLRISISIKEIFRDLRYSTAEILSKLSSIKLPLLQHEMFLLINSNDNDNNNNNNHFIKLVLNLIESIKQHNPSKFIMSYKYCLYNNNNNNSCNIINDINNDTNNGFKLCIIALLLYILPEIRIWRILLIERSSCKGDKLSSVLVNIKTYILIFLIFY